MSNVKYSFTAAFKKLGLYVGYVRINSFLRVSLRRDSFSMQRRSTCESYQRDLGQPLTGRRETLQAMTGSRGRRPSKRPSNDTLINVLNIVESKLELVC